MITLDKKELAIMELFWREKKDLTHKDILTLIDKSVSRNAVYMHLNTLLEKGAIKIGPSVRCGRTYGRTFSPTISKEEYAATQVKDCISADEQTLRHIFSMFLGSNQVTSQTLDALEEKIRQKRKELDG